MSSNTKQVLAITLGSLGLIIGIFGTVVAYNAKQASDDDQNVTAEVQAQFAAAQSAQDTKEANQASKAEKLIAGLSNNEKSLARKINSNGRGLRQGRKRIRNLRQTTNTLSNRYAELDREITSVENSQQKDFNTLTRRINNLNQEIKDLQRALNRLRNRVSIDEDFSN